MCDRIGAWAMILSLALIGAQSDAVAQDLRGTPNGRYNNHPVSNYPSSGYADSFLGGHGGRSWNHSHSHGWNNRWNGWGGSAYFGGGWGFGGFGPSFYYSSGYFPPYGGVPIGTGWAPNYYQSTVTANFWNPYGVYYRPSDNYVEYFLPPHEPAELRWGPQAIKQFMGVDRNFAMGPLRSQNLTDLPNPTYPTLTPELLRVALGERKQPGLPEASLPAARERAARYVASGDRLFNEQRIHEAMARYRDALAAAPDLAASQFRLGLGYLATGRMEEGADAFKRGMELDPQYIFTTSFELNELYEGSPLAKNALLEGMARRTLNDPHNSDNLFCVGVVLFLDGERDTARKYFAAARMRMTGAGDAHLRPFLAGPVPGVVAPGGLDL